MFIASDLCVNQPPPVGRWSEFHVCTVFSVVVTVGDVPNNEMEGSACKHSRYFFFASFYKLVVGCFLVLSCFTLDANRGPVSDVVLLSKRVAIVVVAKSVTR